MYTFLGKITYSKCCIYHENGIHKPGDIGKMVIYGGSKCKSKSNASKLYLQDCIKKKSKTKQNSKCKHPCISLRVFIILYLFII